MSTSESSSFPDSSLARIRLKDVRETLLALHKSLLDSERTSYEIVYGPIAGPGAFLQMLINDPWFGWLRPITTLVVLIDETLAAKKPPATDRDFEQLLVDTRALLSPSREQNGFWSKYTVAVERDPAVAMLHEQIGRQLTGLS